MGTLVNGQAKKLCLAKIVLKNYETIIIISRARHITSTSALAIILHLLAARDDRRYCPTDQCRHILGIGHTKVLIDFGNVEHIDRQKKTGRVGEWTSKAKLYKSTLMTPNLIKHIFGVFGRKQIHKTTRSQQLFSGRSFGYIGCNRDHTGHLCSKREHHSHQSTRIRHTTH